MRFRLFYEMNGRSIFSTDCIHIGGKKQCHGYLPIILREKVGYKTTCIIYFRKRGGSPYTQRLMVIISEWGDYG